MARQWRSVGRDIPKIENRDVYHVDIKPWHMDAPTSVFESYGYKDARVANYLTGSATKKVVEAFSKTQFAKHYEVVLQRVDTESVFERDAKRLAQERAKRVDELYDRAMRKIASFYQNDLYKQWGSEWDYQPKGGLTSNSTH